MEARSRATRTIRYCARLPRMPAIRTRKAFGGDNSEVVPYSGRHPTVSGDGKRSDGHRPQATAPIHQARLSQSLTDPIRVSKTANALQE